MKNILISAILASSFCSLSCVITDPNLSKNVPTVSSEPEKPAPSLAVHSGSISGGREKVQLEINGHSQELKEVSFIRPIPVTEYAVYSIPPSAKKAFIYKDVGAHEEDASKMYIDARNGRVTVYETNIFPGEMDTKDWKPYRSFAY